MNNEKAVRIGAEVDRMLASEGFELAMQSIESELTQDWKNAKTKETREEIWSRYRNLDHIRTKLKALVDNGVVAQKAIDAEKKRDEATRKKGQV